MKEWEPLIRIVDDDQSLLFSTQIYLEACGWKVVTYDSPEKFLMHDNLDIPGCIVLDFRMPGMTGMEVQENIIRNGFGHIPIIFLSGHGDIEMAVNAMTKGAVTFLEKPADPERLNSEISRAVKLSLARKETVQKKNELKRKFNQLTQREKEVLSLVANGLSNKDIGEKLGLSIATVKMHRGNATEKLELSSAAEITRAFILMQEQNTENA